MKNRAAMPKGLFFYYVTILIVIVAIVAGTLYFSANRQPLCEPGVIPLSGECRANGIK